MRHLRKQGESRREIVAVILAATVLFLLALGAAAWLRSAMPQRQIRRIRAAIEAGDADQARELTGRWLDPEQRRDWEQAIDYAQADALMAAGRWEEARSAFGALGNYADSAEKMDRCVLALGNEALERGELSQAEDLFRSISAMDMVDETHWRAALLAESEGRWADALRGFLALGDYAGAAERAGALAVRLTGESDPEKALLAVSALSPGELARREEMVRRRSLLPGQVLDVGFYHTVGLRSDGAVLAAGDDTYGQCRVSDWTDITAICAGAYHTVGLRADGSVLAAGRNDEGQCDVSDWSGIVQIAAADYATFGLKSDGTVVHTGFGAFDETAQWTQIRYITGGSYALGALRAGGTALISHLSARSDELTGLTSLAVNTGYAVGLREDGTVVSPQVPLPGWEDILTVSASGTAVLGLRADGTVAALFFRPGDDPGVAGERDVVALAAGGTHFAFLRADGTVSVLGGTGRGETDTASWRLFSGS